MSKEAGNDFIPQTGFMRLPQVLIHIPVSKSTWDRGVAEGRYPSPVPISARAVGYRVEEIRKLISDMGSSDNTDSEQE
ncbi:MAG: AlpA family phage regulatory protein [Ghiorsea sp.]